MNRDAFGIPQKVNRHVYKAVNSTMERGATFQHILQYVTKCTRTGIQVPDIERAVRASLRNFQDSGIVMLNKSNRYKIRNGAKACTEPISLGRDDGYSCSSRTREQRAARSDQKRNLPQETDITRAPQRTRPSRKTRSAQKKKFATETLKRDTCNMNVNQPNASLPFKLLNVIESGENLRGSVCSVTESNVGASRTTVGNISRTASNQAAPVLTMAANLETTPPQPHATSNTNMNNTVSNMDFDNSEVVQPQNSNQETVTVNVNCSQSNLNNLPTINEMSNVFPRNNAPTQLSSETVNDEQSMSTNSVSYDLTSEDSWVFLEIPTKDEYN